MSISYNPLIQKHNLNTRPCYFMPQQKIDNSMVTSQRSQGTRPKSRSKSKASKQSKKTQRLTHQASTLSHRSSKSTDLNSERHTYSVQPASTIHSQQPISYISHAPPSVQQDNCDILKQYLQEMETLEKHTNQMLFDSQINYPQTHSNNSRLGNLEYSMDEEEDPEFMRVSQVFYQVNLIVRAFKVLKSHWQYQQRKNGHIDSIQPYNLTFDSPLRERDQNVQNRDEFINIQDIEEGLREFENISRTSTTQMIAYKKNLQSNQKENQIQYIPQSPQKIVNPFYEGLQRIQTCSFQKINRHQSSNSIEREMTRNQSSMQTLQDAFHSFKPCDEAQEHRQSCNSIERIKMSLLEINVILGVHKIQSFLEKNVQRNQMQIFYEIMIFKQDSQNRERLSENEIITRALALENLQLTQAISQNVEQSRQVQSPSSQIFASQCLQTEEAALETILSVKEEELITIQESKDKALQILLRILPQYHKKLKQSFFQKFKWDTLRSMYQLSYINQMRANELISSVKTICSITQNFQQRLISKTFTHLKFHTQFSYQLQTQKQQHITFQEEQALLKISRQRHQDTQISVHLDFDCPNFLELQNMKQSLNLVQEQRIKQLYYNLKSTLKNKDLTSRIELAVALRIALNQILKGQVTDLQIAEFVGQHCQGSQEVSIKQIFTNLKDERFTKLMEQQSVSGELVGSEAITQEQMSLMLYSKMKEGDFAEFIQCLNEALSLMGLQMFQRLTQRECKQLMSHFSTSFDSKKFNPSFQQEQKIEQQSEYIKKLQAQIQSLKQKINVEKIDFQAQHSPTQDSSTTQTESIQTISQHMQTEPKLLTSEQCQTDTKDHICGFTQTDKILQLNGFSQTEKQIFNNSSIQTEKVRTFHEQSQTERVSGLNQQLQTEKEKRYNANIQTEQVFPQNEGIQTEQVCPMNQVIQTEKYVSFNEKIQTEGKTVKGRNVEISAKISNDNMQTQTFQQMQDHEIQTHSNQKQYESSDAKPKHIKLQSSSLKKKHQKKYKRKFKHQEAQFSCPSGSEKKLLREKSSSTTKLKSHKFIGTSSSKDLRDCQRYLQRQVIPDELKKQTEEITKLNQKIGFIQTQVTSMKHQQNTPQIITVRMPAQEEKNHSSRMKDETLDYLRSTQKQMRQSYEREIKNMERIISSSNQKTTFALGPNLRQSSPHGLRLGSSIERNKCCDHTRQTCTSRYCLLCK